MVAVDENGLEQSGDIRIGSRVDYALPIPAPNLSSEGRGDSGEVIVKSFLRDGRLELRGAFLEHD
jgi:hypothetical protein